MSGFLAPLASLVENPVINGDFNVWQRGVSFAAMVNNQYMADRFQYSKVGAMVHTGAQTTGVPTSAGRVLNYALSVNCTTIDAAIAASDYCSIFHKVEGFNFLPFAQRPFWVSFWVYATKTGVYCFRVANSLADRSFVAEFTVAASNTWQLVTVAVPASPSAGGWNYTNGIGARLAWTLASGTDFQTTPGAWQTGAFLATANQVNACDAVNNDFRIAGVRMSLVPYPLAYNATRTFSDELVLCQRYFEKSYNNANYAGAVSNGGALIERSYATGSLLIPLPWKVSKRAAPTVIAYSPVTGASGQSADYVAGVDRATGAGSIGETACYLDVAAAVSGNYTGTHWTADAEL